jgi:ribonucleotide reductase alpha subunit
MTAPVSRFTLNDEFVESYAGVALPFGFNGLGNMVYMRTYSRLKQDGSGNEQWHETIRRVVEGTYEIQRQYIEKLALGWDEVQGQRSAREMFDRMFNMKFLPPGRGLWAMGTPIITEKHLGASLNNCFSGDTEVWVGPNLNNLKLVSLQDLYNREEPFQVVTPNPWKTSPATVNLFGQQQLALVSFAPLADVSSKFRLKYEVTRNHRWFLSNGSVTTNLTVGDCVKLTYFDLNPSFDGFAHGLVFDCYNRGSYVCLNSTLQKIIISGEFNQVVEMVEQSKFHHKTVIKDHGETHVYFELPDGIDWREMPTASHEISYQTGFLNGWISSSTIANLDTQNVFIVRNIKHQNEINWILERAPLLGYGVYDVKTTEVLLTKTPLTLKVESIAPYRQENVFCITEPETSSFMLSGGLITGNCAYVSTKGIGKYDKFSKPFIFLMDMSMLGVGVGFDTHGSKNGFIVKQPLPLITNLYTIEDTREGWVQSVEILMDSYETVESETLIFDYSKIRAAGLPLKTFGGLSSGHKPLETLHVNIRKTLDSNVGKTLTLTAIVDIMNMIGKCVVAGNVRRTAEISFGDHDSEEFMDLKNYSKNPERAEFGWTSNNSIFAPIGMDYTSAAARVKMNGEPGFAWLENMKAYSRMGDPPDHKDSRVEGGNPCVVATTVVMTADGPKTVDSLVGKPFLAVINESSYECKSGFFKTGTKPVYNLITEEGLSVRLTDNHKILTTQQGWVEARDLRPGNSIVVNNLRHSDWQNTESEEFEDGWLTAFMLTGGHVQNRDALRYFGRNNSEYMLSTAVEFLKDTADDGFERVERLTKKFSIDADQNILTDQILLTSSCFHKGFLRGLFNALGVIEHDQCIIVLKLLSPQHFPMVQQMFLHLGIFSKKCYNILSDLTELIIADDNAVYFQQVVDFGETLTAKAWSESVSLLNGWGIPTNAESFTATFKSLDYVGIEEVFDCTVETVHRFDANGLIVHNCLEQSLETYELCCLVETFPNRCTDIEDYLRTLKFAYLYAKTVTLCLTHWTETNRVLLRNRRIGCSVSGVAQFLAKHDLATLKEWLERGYKIIQEWDRVYSDWFCIPRSVKTTSVKPSGTVSLLAGSTPGMHYPEARFYIRRMRISKESPLVQSLKDAGYPLEVAVGSDGDTLVVEIPVDAGEGVRTVGEVSMWEQFSLAAFLQRYWADNQVSCTVTFDPEKEGGQIANALNYFQYQLKGISLLPRCGYGAFPQMPYEAITQEEYKQRDQTIDYSRLDFYKQTKHHQDGEGEVFCDGDNCKKM